MEDGWTDRTRYDGLTYEYSDEHPSPEWIRKSFPDSISVTLTVTDSHGKVKTYPISPGTEERYRQFIDRTWPPVGWEYLGEQDYSKVWRQILFEQEVFQHAIGGDVLSLDCYIPETNCPATAMRWVGQYYTSLKNAHTHGDTNESAE